MEILKNFGFDPMLLAAQIVNFLIIFYLLKRFMYKPVLEMIKKREDKIAEGLKQAEEARITLEKTIEEEKKILNKASEEAKKITEEAKLRAIEISKEIEENTKQQVEKSLIEARAQIAQESESAERKLTEKISIVAKLMLTKTLEGAFGEKEQKQIVNKALKQIEKVN